MNPNWRILTLLLFFIPAIAWQAECHALEKHYSSGNSRVSLIELFTSEGCSSCPPAEKWLNSLQHNPGLWTEFVPVAFHVDYWDYIGWKDPFASSSNGFRQKQYKKQGDISAVYTPGMLLNGKEWRGWYYQPQVPATNGIAGNLDVTVNGDNIIAIFSPAISLPVEWELNIVILGFQLRSTIDAGENAGRRLDQDFVVLAHEKMISNNGKWKMKLPGIKNEHSQHAGLAAWVNLKGKLSPVQATGGWLSE